MGKALVKADYAEVIKLILKWSRNNNFSIVEKSSGILNGKNAQTKQLHRKTRLYTATWHFLFLDEGVIIDLKLKPRAYFNVILYTILFFSLFYCSYLVGNILTKYTYREVLLFMLSATCAIVIIWWKDNRLSLKLAKTENCFWEMIGRSYDLRQLTRFSGRLYSRGTRLTTEIALSFAVIYICTLFLGVLGFVISILLCGLFLTMIIAEIMRKENPQWHWRFWIMANMGRWTFLMLAVLGVLAMLLSVEFFSHLKLYECKELLSPITAIQTGQFRNISPAMAELLEEDCQRYIYGLAENDFSDVDFKSDMVRSEKIRKRIRTYSLILFIIILIACVSFTIVPLIGLLKSHKIWRYDLTQHKSQHIPSVPYLPHAWKWQTPITLRLLIFFHYLIGGVINLTAAIFCIDGLSYLIVGRSLFLNKTANLWSWVFADCKILFGQHTGQLIAAIYVSTISLPILILLVTFIRRLLVNLFLVARFIHTRLTQNEHLVSMQNYIRQTCQEYKIKTPSIVLTESKDTVLTLHWLPFGGKSIIEISRGTINILSPEELKAAIAHEIGHIRQGPWKVGFLKLLSSIALFPNYYLTLCMDWAKNEIDADRFVMVATNDPQSLKQALIKISTAQISCPVLDSNSRYLNKWCKGFIGTIKRKFNSLLISVNFFFGDGLLGYAHPYLSERLQAIDSYKI